MSDGIPLFEMRNIAKAYGGVRALEDAQLRVEAGRIHAVLGENGAGKSTLIKIMSGVVQPDHGIMRLDGTEMRFASPKAANASGIVCIFQELSLIPDLSVADNIAISGAPKRFGLIDRKAQRRFAEEALARAGAEDIHPLALVKDLPLSRRQMVEIAKALGRKPRILILDEATSALTAGDVAKVFTVLKRLRSEGLALLYISHRMQEIDELADDCSVFRNGRHVASYAQGSKSRNEVIEMMIGREYSHVFPAKPEGEKAGAPALEVANLSWNQRLSNISFKARPGEIVGLGGLDGQGQRELLLALFGVLRGVSGDIAVGGVVRNLKNPRAAKDGATGMALIPEDRKTEGLMLPMSVKDNLTLPALDSLAKAGIIDRQREAQEVDRMVKLLAIKAANLDIPVGALSGGNQQKVVIAKWLMIGPKIILLNDPTRGIDVGTKQEIYQLLRKLADDGATILFYSTDYDELIGCCDRVLVMYDGSIVRELKGTEITEHALVSSAFSIDATQTGSGKLGDFRYWLAEHKGTLLAVAVFVIMFAVYTGNHSAGFSSMVVMTAANKGVLLALVAMAQTLVVLTAGIDLSVGMIFVLANCLASTLVVGDATQTSIGVIAVLAAGVLCGAINGAIVIYGRLQPIVTTLATGAMFYGVALWLRPVPGGDINSDLADALTDQVYGVPTALLVLLGIVLIVWVPLRRSEVGRAIYAIGSSEPAAYMSGVSIDKARFTAYAVSGLLSACGGLMLTFITYSGEASASIGGSYTLNSIAAVVIGGVSLFGGAGSAIGAIFGAFVLRTIGDLLFVFDFDPLWQPLFQGVILLLAVTLGSLRLLRLKNRLDLFG